VERYSEHLAVTAAASFGLTLAVSRSLARAGSVAVSTLPKAAPMGRDAFAATLGRALASRGVVVVDRQALRRLDRIDAVVLDAGALVSERLAIGDVVPVGGGEVDQVALAVYRLADPAAPLRRRSDGEFTLAPLEELDLVGVRGVRAAAALTRGGAVAVLGLARARRLQAVIAVVREPAGAADALAAATRRAGLDLVVAGAASGPAARSADRVVPGGSRLVASVRALQGDGQGVLLVSRSRRALVAADVGLGVPATDGTPAWGADILLRDDLSAAALLIEAAGAEAAVSRRGVNLARAGTALGAAMALSGRAGRLSGRSLLAVNSTAAASMAAGVWTATELLRRPVSPPVSRTPWHAMPAEAVLRAVDSTAAGLTGPEARRRRRGDADEKDGTPSLLRAFATELANPLTPILVAGAALSASIGAVTDAAIVVGVGGVSALIGGVQRVATDRAVAELLRRSAIYGRVLRSGQDQVLPAGELVVGDVVRLVSGDVVPADCRIIEAHEVEVDESSLTGESLPVRKQVNSVLAGDIADRRSMIYEGTTVAAGRCLAVVVATGSSTEVGRSLAATRPASRVSGVEARLAAITRTTLPIALGSAGAVMLAGILRGRPARDSLGAGVGLAVASVPEGLPFLVSAAQLSAARRLSGRGVLVRDPRTIETLGRVDVLCFDKTGTLTEGRIAVRGVSTGGRLQPPAALDDGARAALVAAVRATPRARGSRAPEHLTDRAVLEGAGRASVRREEGYRVLRRLGTLPFEPSRGFHAVLDDADGDRLLSVKGAPEVVLPRCTGWIGREPGTDWRAAAEAEVERLTGRGYRVLAVAERSGVGPTRLSESAVAGLTLRGFIAFADPVRGQAGASVRDLRAAGVQVVMITGDHPRTAAAIGDELGVTNGGRVVTGAQLDALDDAALDELLPQVSVVARSTPTHKVRVVQAFQRLGRTVAMTGDGANDAPAIRLADVGIALGRRGTPAARAAADLVVTDDRLETILAALIEGRAMWGSVRRALGILVGGNLGEIAFTLFGAALTGRSPLSARQLLLVNMLTDLAPAVALAVRPPEESAVATLLAEGPEASLGGVLVDEIAVRALATAAGASGAWIAGRLTGRPARARTIGLAALVGTQLGQTLVAGGASPSVVFASLGSAAALIGVVQTPGVSQFFGCAPLGPVGWTTAAGWAAAGTAGSLALPPLWRAARPRGERIVVRLQGRQRRPLHAIPATVGQLGRGRGRHPEGTWAATMAMSSRAR
jgi:cation-transporting ATPase I